MWTRLRKFIQGDRRPVVPAVENAALGTLTYSVDDESWVTSPGLSFQIFFAGNRDERFAEIAPDEALVQHAESVALAPKAFLDVVAPFVVQETARHSGLRHWAEEAAQLRMSALNLPWPQRPDDGMIEFDGPDEFRLWRCNYVNRTPAGPLGFAPAPRHPAATGLEAAQPLRPPAAGSWAGAPSARS